MQNTVAIVRAWQEAANAQNKGRLLELSDPDIEIVGPRGSAHGREVLAVWLGQAGLILETTRTFTRGDAVVLAQHGVWRAPEAGEVTGEADLASSYRVADGRVTRFPATTAWTKPWSRHASPKQTRSAASA